MKILFLDIETAPNQVFVWGLWDQNIAPNQIVNPGYPLCWSAKWADTKGVMFDSLEKNPGPAMIKAMHELLEEAHVVIHYNGAKFDIPVLNAEFIMHGMHPPSPVHQIDLYKVVKKNFKFPSYKLDYVAQQFGIGHKVRHKGMDLWTGCMNGDPASWRVMEKYNKQDVNLLVKLYAKLLPWIANHPSHALFDGKLDRPSCPNCGSTHVQKHGQAITKTCIYDRYKCMGCGKPLRGRTTIVPKDAKNNILVGA